MNKINARAMAEGAILAALTAIFGIFYNVPVVGIITMFWPVPIVIVGYRNGFRISLIAAFIAALLVSLIVSPLIGIILFVTYALPGSVMGYMLRKNINPYTILGLCGLLLGITAVLEFVLSLELVLGIDVVNALLNFNESMNSYFGNISKQAAEAGQLYRQFGFDETTIQEVMKSFNDIIDNMKLLLPSAMLLAGITVSYLNFKVVKTILGRMGYKIRDIRKFSEWSLGGTGKLVLLGATLAILLMMNFKIQFLYSIYMNIWVFIYIIYGVLGLSLVSYIIEKLAVKYEIPRSVQRLLLVVALVMFMSLLPFVGMFDVAADIRRFDKNTIGGVR